MQIIIHQINKNLMKLALDIYGTHVIEKILISFDKELCNEIFNFFILMPPIKILFSTHYT